MASVDSVLPNRIANTASYLELTDATGVVTQFVPNSNGQVSYTKNGAAQSPSFLRPTIAKAASYTCPVAECGALYTTNTGAVTFTLPAVATSNGVWFEFINGVDANMAITAPAGTLVSNDGTTATVAGTTGTFSTASHKIGASARVICDGAKWYLSNIGYAVLTVT
jgi:hypothetical protein